MWSIIGVCYLVILSVFGQELPIVNISQGIVIGSVADVGSYFEFHGIPYADSTSGVHRFKAPRRPPSFDNNFIANRKDVKCIRPLGIGFEGTEDCLVTSVFTPNLNSTARLPVMVWIKGREFDKAYHHFSFRNFVEKDVVIVTLNFRESILGFLCIGTETAPGNAGLKDIIAGLRWVQENIAQFGGDPNNVSLFGHGSGAAAVDLVTVSPMATGLVHKAIAQSGTAIAPWAVTRDNLEYAIEVAEKLGHIVSNVEELSELFTRTSVAALMAVINELELTDNSLAFAPCVERELENEEPFLTKSPYQTLIEDEFLKIPFMTGFVDKEGTIRAEEATQAGWLEKMDTSFTDFIQPDLEFENDIEEDKIAQEIRTFYFGDETIDTSMTNNYLQYHGDTMILVSAIREARLRAANSAIVYLYQFSYRGSLGESFTGPLEVSSAAHSEELAYMLYEDPSTETSAMDLSIGDILLERWTNFAKTGEPTSETSQISWRPFTAENPYYLRILDDEEVSNGTLDIELQNPHADTILFWNQIYEEHFIDARSRWNISVKNEEDDDLVENPDVEEEPSLTTPPPGVEGGGDGGEDTGNEDDDDDNSATTVVGSTFLIVTSFSILSHYHSYQLMS